MTPRRRPRTALTNPAERRSSSAPDEDLHPKRGAPEIAFAKRLTDADLAQRVRHAAPLHFTGQPQELIDAILRTAHEVRTEMPLADVARGRQRRGPFFQDVPAEAAADIADRVIRS